MSHPADALLNAQLQFFMQDFTGDALVSHVEIEADAYCDLLETISARDLLSESQVISWIERNILGYSPTDTMRAQAVMLVELGLNNPSHQQQPMRQLINKQIYDLIVQRLVERPALRQELIHSALSSPVYTRVLSDVVYHSIVDYLTTDNIIARRVPGFSSLVKAGRGMLGRMGRLDDTLEQAIKAYLARNIAATAAFSESLVDKALNNDAIAQFAELLWPRLEAYQLGQATRHLETQGLSYLAVLYWNQIRQTDYMKQQITLLVQAWFAHAGDMPAMHLLHLLGIERDHLVREVVAIGEPLVNAWRESGYIERRLKEHLTRFFDDPATRTLLKDLQGPQT
ncbi:MAG: hypothetical protein ABIR53_08430 [Paraperlucidibaca sp.]